MNNFELGWLCGILEGEASFTICRSFKRDNRRNKSYASVTCMIRVSSTDKEVVEKIHRITGLGTVKPKKIHSPLSKKEQFEWRVNKKDELRKILPQIIGSMSARRQEKIQEILSHLASLV